MDMWCEYKDAFSLRGEMGTCPNIEAEIDSLDTPVLLNCTP